MATKLARVMDRAVRAAARAARSELTDADLLERFAAGDQEAFVALVARHAGMVFGVCRRWLGHEQDAEDACQATFLVLVQKASRQRWQPSVANWLYSTARRVAARARLAADRRGVRERKAARPEGVSSLEPMTGREALAALDEELDRLPALYREPLVLCYLEGLTCDEAAARVGIPTGTLKCQLARGRQKLGDALARRGLGVGLLGVTSPARASAPRLVEAILAAVSGTPPDTVAALARGVSMNALVNRSLGLVLAATAVVWLGIGTWWARPSGARLAADREQPAAEKAKSKAPPPAPSEGRAFSGRVVGPDGKPVAGAAIVLGDIGADEKQTTHKLATTDESGHFRCVVPALPGRRFDSRQLVARASGLAADWVTVRDVDPARPIVLRLAKAAVPVRGRIRTLEGKPVVGALVRIRHVQAPDGKTGLKQVYEKWTASPYHAANLLPRRLYYPVAAGLPEKVTTDAEGRFVIRGAGDGRLLSLEFSAETIETVLARVAVDATFDPKAARFDARKADPSSPYSRTGPLLYGATFDHAARPCRVIQGTVFDQKTKKPLAGVGVTGRVRTGWWEEGVFAKTDAAGRYRLTGVANVECELTFGVARPLTYLWMTRTVRPGAGLAPATLDMPMTQGTVVTGRVSDRASGKPIQGTVRYATLSGNKHLLDLPGREIHADGTMTYDLDADGRFRLVAPPGPGILVAQAAQAKPYAQARIRAEDKNTPALRSRPGLGDSYITSRGHIHTLAGYHAYRVIEPAPGAAELTADLQVDSGTSVAGKVVGPDGKPFAGATVAGLIATFERPTTLDGADFTARALLAEDTRTVSAVHTGKKLAGTAVVRAGAKEPAVIRLAAWGALTGRIVDEDGAPLAGARVRLYFHVQTASDLHRHLIGSAGVTTDAAGRFRCDVLFAGVEVGLMFDHKGKRLATTTPLRNLTVKPGETKSMGDVAVKGIE
jgi:RNA polymerase sigma factor (sigma-70 family)